MQTRADERRLRRFHDRVTLEGANRRLQPLRASAEYAERAGRGTLDQRLAALERWKIEEEHKQVQANIDYLEDLLACPVDLVTEKALRPELKPFVEREAFYV